MSINNFTIKSQESSGKKFRSEAKLVTPESRLRPLTFGSFLTTQFQTIAEDDGDESDYRTAQLEPYETRSYQAARRLQFPKEDSLAQLTPLGSRLMSEKGRFDIVEERDTVMQDGPYTYFNKPFVLQNWDIDIEFNPDCITTIPLWITFPRLPVGYWCSEVLSKVASAIGKPLYTDRFTATMAKISYAKVLV
ncbi:hypothetical protein MTR67_051742 [Solanum verrucosum]|uniref:DUF4283 domain-containing protein n=1 Tax=Solanum verrucosum TaxID=315347 RepID=A0AAF0V4Z1_SOLVR|nr:hypothetical protein MTR67_051742 [Solanum verrucosum]